MAEQEQQRRDKKAQPQDEAPEAARIDADLSDVDELLDEIDSVLEENAEEFVKNYVQKGGQ